MQDNCIPFTGNIQDPAVFHVLEYTIHLRCLWARAFFGPLHRLGFSLQFKDSGLVITFMRRCDLQNTDHEMPFWLFLPAAAKEKTLS